MTDSSASSAPQTPAASPAPANGSKLKASGNAVPLLKEFLTIAAECVPNGEFWEALNRKDILCPRLAEHSGTRSAMMTAITPHLGRGTFEFDAALVNTLDADLMATLIDYALAKGEKAKHDARTAFTPVLIVEAMPAYVGWSIVSSGSHIEKSDQAVVRALDAIDKLNFLEPKRKMELIGRKRLLEAMLTKKPELLKSIADSALERGEAPNPSPLTSGEFFTLVSNATIVELLGSQIVFREVIVPVARDLGLVPQNWKPTNDNDIDESDIGKPETPATESAERGDTLRPSASATPPATPPAAAAHRTAQGPARPVLS